MATVATIEFTGGGLRNSDVATGAGIAASKLKHQYTIDAELIEQGTEISAVEKLLHIVRGGTATLVAFEGITAAEGVTSGTVNVDLQRSTGGAAFASITTTDIVIQYNSAELVPIAATLNTTALVDGDVLKAVVSIAGGGTYPDGLLVTLTIEEDPA